MYGYYVGVLCMGVMYGCYVGVLCRGAMYGCNREQHCVTKYGIVQFERQQQCSSMASAGRCNKATMMLLLPRG